MVYKPNIDIIDWLNAWMMKNTLFQNVQLTCQEILAYLVPYFEVIGLHVFCIHCFDKTVPFYMLYLFRDYRNVKWL